MALSISESAALIRRLLTSRSDLDSSASGPLAAFSPVSDGAGIAVVADTAWPERPLMTSAQAQTAPSSSAANA